MYLGFDPFESFYWSMFLFIIGIILSLKISKIIGINYKLSSSLYFWHILLCFVYFFYVLSNGGDAISYFRWAVDNNVNLNFGTAFVINFTAFFVNYLKFSFIDLFVLYNFFGYVGVLFFAASIIQAIKVKKLPYRLFGLLFIFLPSVSFWTSALGKDSLAFMATGMALWGALNYKNRKWLIILSIFLMLLVRPHIAFVLLISFILSLILDKKVSFYTRIFMGSIASIVSIVMLPVIINYVGLEEGSGIDDVSDYVDKRQGYNAGGGSSIDISSMSLPMQMLTYLFRPLPFEAHSIFALLASFDNIILILLVLMGLYFIFKKNKPSIESNRLFLWLYFYLSLIILASTTANLGIAMRQKWMILPFLIFLLLSVIGNNELKIEKIK